MTDAIAGWKWVITKLSNGFYTIKNVAYETYASIVMGEFDIKAIDRENSWKIHKTRYVGEYLYVRTFHQRPGCIVTIFFLR